MSDARSRARSLRSRDAKPAADEPAAPEPPATVPDAGKPRKVRQTVDLTQQRHRDLAAYRMDTALALGRTRLTTQDVLAHMVELVLTDPQTSRKLRQLMEQEEQERR